MVTDDEVEYTVATLFLAMTQHLYGVFATRPVTVPLVVVLATSTATLLPTLFA